MAEINRGGLHWADMDNLVYLSYCQGSWQPGGMVIGTLVRSWLSYTYRSNVGGAIFPNC